jgi:glutamate synthase domain-containing protein 3
VNVLCGLQGSVSKSYNIINVDRSALGRVAGAIAKPYGDNGFKGAVNLKLTGALRYDAAFALVQSILYSAIVLC